MFEDLVSNDLIRTKLANRIKSGRIPGVFLFSGRSGVGKKSFSLEYSKIINCGSADPGLMPCRKCSNCRAVDNRSFSDLMVIEKDAEKTDIPVGRIRMVQWFLSSRPVLSKYKTVIIDNAEDLNRFSSNALLKLLEEPPDYAVIFLITSNLFKISATLRSRCQIYRFREIPQDQLKEYIKKNHGYEETYDTVAELCSGSISDAEFLIKNSGLSLT